MSKEPMKVLTEESIDPTQQLWRAVLSQAFQDAFGPPRSDTSTTERKEAQVFLTDYEDVSFINVCENAGFNPNFVAKKVEKTIDRHKICRDYLAKIKTTLKGENYAK
jgi:hypothetical protein